MPVTAIILAAGRSTRLKSKRPKPLHEVCGRPMLWHVLQACYQAGCEKVLVVVGYGKDQIVAQFADDPRIVWVDQPQQLGTAHAAQMCQKALKKFTGDVFVLAADAPLISGQVLRNLLTAHLEEKAVASIATAVLDHPEGFSRVARDAKGNFVAIVEESDATADQKAIKEIFPAYYCIKSSDLCQGLPKLKRTGRNGETRLSDIFGILRAEGKKIVAVQAVSAEEVLTVNTRQQLAEVDLIMQEQIQRQLRDSGVTIVNSFNTYIEAGVSIGPDTVIRPFTFIGRDTTIGPNCTVGPFAHIPADSIIPEQTTIAGTPTVGGGVEF